MAKGDSLTILHSLHAETLLEGERILARLQGIRAKMVYKERPFSDYFDAIQDSITKIGTIRLRSGLSAVEISDYNSDLANTYTAVNENINRLDSDSGTLLTYCEGIYAQVNNLKTTFLVYWALAASDIVGEHKIWKKLSVTDIKAIATEEFTVVLDGADIELSAMIECLKMTREVLKNARKLNIEKYAVGKDQINAAALENTYSDKGIQEHKSTTHHPSAAQMITLKGIFGDRVKDTPPPPPVEDDFPPTFTKVIREAGFSEPVDDQVRSDGLGDVEPLPALVPSTLEPAPVEVKSEEPKAKRKRRRRDPVTGELMPLEADDLPPVIGEQLAIPFDEEIPTAFVEPEEVMATPITPEETILTDPFIGKVAAAKIVEHINVVRPVEPEEEDLPPTVVKVVKPSVAVDEEEDGPPTELQSSAVMEDEEDLSFLNTAVAVDKTPATTELAEMAATPEPVKKASPPPEPAKAVVPPPEQVKVVTPEPVKASTSVPEPVKASPPPLLKPRGSGLFRGANTMAAGQKAAPPFVPTKVPINGVSVLSLEELM